MKKLQAVLPDGTIASRTTEHDYKFICAVRETEKGITGEWFAQWSGTLKWAEAMARKWHNSDWVKSGRSTFETKVIPVS